MKSLPRLLFYIFLAVTVLGVFVPFWPTVPTAGLDPSWALAVNQAAGQGLVFGRDVVFTYGPYAAVMTKYYHPLTDFRTICASLYLSVSYFSILVLLMRGASWFWAVVFAVMLAIDFYLADAVFLGIPLLVGLLVFKMVRADQTNSIAGRWSYVWVALIFAPLGLLPLIKGSLLILSAAVILLCAGYFLLAGARSRAIICLLSPAVSMFLFWFAAGQPPAGLMDYLVTMWPIASGYTVAMGREGNNTEVFIYIILSIFIFFPIMLQKNFTRTERFYLFLLCFLHLFVSMKAGFVRHDGHALISASGLLFAYLSIFLIIKGKMKAAIFIVVSLSSFYIYNNYLDIYHLKFFYHVPSSYISPWNGFLNRAREKDWPRTDFDAALARIRAQAPLPDLPGTTDIYSFEQAALLASGNSWNPRPVFQSYSAYTPSLADMNRRHLAGKQAPDNIIFNVQPIGARLASLEDGASWPNMLLNYQPTGIAGTNLHLRRREGHLDDVNLVPDIPETGRLEQQIIVPDGRKPVFARIKVTPTWFGRVANILFRPSPLFITVELENGTERRFTFVPGMAEAPFLISPLIEETAEFAALYGPEAILREKKVRSFRISAKSGLFASWKPRFDMGFQAFDWPRKANLGSVINLNQAVDMGQDGQSFPTDACDAGIDRVNHQSRYAPPGFKDLRVARLLVVDGWLAASATAGVLPEATYVVLTDPQGKRRFFTTSIHPRSDVARFFGIPTLDRAGFLMTADTSGLSGRYELGLARKASGSVQVCSQFQTPIEIVP